MSWREDTQLLEQGRCVWRNGNPTADACGMGVRVGGVDYCATHRLIVDAQRVARTAPYGASINVPTARTIVDLGTFVAWADAYVLEVARQATANGKIESELNTLKAERAAVRRFFGEVAK